MTGRLVAHRLAKRAQDGPRREERTIKLSRKLRHETDPYASLPALHDERLAVKPKPVGEACQQWRNRSKDAPAGRVRAHVGCERTSVDYDGDRRSGWE
jgi:hypothetical protein